MEAMGEVPGLEFCLDVLLPSRTNSGEIVCIILWLLNMTFSRCVEFLRLNTLVMFEKEVPGLEVDSLLTSHL